MRMARKKKDGRFINYYIDRLIYERLERYADDRGQPVTAALERILDESLTRYEQEAAAVERYCPGCHVLVHAPRCPVCDRKWLEPPLPEDYCFLVEKEFLWAGILEDCLRRNGIAYLTQNALGAGLTSKMGNMLERTKFYVRYAHYREAQALEEELFRAQTEDYKEEEA